MVRPDKVTAVAEIAEKFRGSSASVVTEYRGLSMAKPGLFRFQLGTPLIGGVILAVLIASQVTNHGESTWYMGLQLLAVYAVLGFAFLFA